MPLRIKFSNDDLKYFFPRIYEINHESLGYYFRWGFSAHALAEQSVDEMARWNLNWEITFQLDSKKHRRMEFKQIVGYGWMQVQLLTLHADDKTRYLIASCFTDIGKRVEFHTLETLFDHVGEIETSSEAAPPHVTERTNIELERHEEMSLAHWKEHRRSRFRKRSKVVDDFKDSSVTRIEEMLESVKQELKQLRAIPVSEKPMAQGQFEKLQRQKSELRQLLLDREQQHHNAQDNLVASTSYSNEAERQTLFTLRWKAKKAQKSTTK